MPKNRNRRNRENSKENSTNNKTETNTPNNNVPDDKKFLVVEINEVKIDSDGITATNEEAIYMSGSDTTIESAPEGAKTMISELLVTEGSKEWLEVDREIDDKKEDIEVPYADAKDNYLENEFNAAYEESLMKKAELEEKIVGTKGDVISEDEIVEGKLEIKNAVTQEGIKVEEKEEAAKTDAPADETQKEIAVDMEEILDEIKEEPKEQKSDTMPKEEKQSEEQLGFGNKRSEENDESPSLKLKSETLEILSKFEEDKEKKPVEQKGCFESLLDFLCCRTTTQ